MRPLVASIGNPESWRYFNKYVKPNIETKSEMRMLKDHFPFQQNEFIRVHDYNVVDDKICVVATSDKCYMPTFIPQSKLNKYKSDEDKKQNKGISYEKEIVEALNEVQLMIGTGGGSNRNKPDCVITHASGITFNMEVKKNHKAIIGQGVLKYGEDGWGMGFVARAPRFAETISEAKKDGVPVLQILRDTVRKPEKNEIMRGVSIKSDPMDIEPIIAYLKDKKIDILHLGGRGIYSINPSLKDFPQLKGTCRAEIRAKDENSLTIMGRIVEIEPSPVTFDFFNKENLLKIKERYFGYEKSSHADSPPSWIIWEGFRYNTIR